MSTSEECISIPVSVLDEELFYQSFWRRKVIQILLLFFLHFLRDIWKKPKIHFVNMRWITKRHWSVELWLYFTIVIIMQGLNLTDSPQYLLPGDLLWFLNFVFITHQSVRDWLMKESTMDHYVFVSHILICIGFNCAIGISHTRAITGGSNVIDPPPPPLSISILYFELRPNHLHYFIPLEISIPVCYGSGCVYESDKFVELLHHFLWRVKTESMCCQRRVPKTLFKIS